jgi:hypothetical protein
MNIGADTGAFTLTGQDALKGISDVVSQGVFTYTGQAVDMTVQRYFGAETASFTYSFNEFKIRGWLTPNVPAEIWTDVA